MVTIKSFWRVLHQTSKMILPVQSSEKCPANEFGCSTVGNYAFLESWDKCLHGRLGPVVVSRPVGESP